MSKKSVVGTTFIGVLSSILAFLGVVTCCGMPIVAGVLAWLGIGASQLSFFADYRGVFMSIAVIALIFGFWKVYFRNSAMCCEASCCDVEPVKRQNSSIFQQLLLWIGAIVVLIMLFATPHDEESAPISEPLSPAIELKNQPSGCCPK